MALKIMVVIYSFILTKSYSILGVGTKNANFKNKMKVSPTDVLIKILIEGKKWKSAMYGVNWKATNSTYYCGSINEDHGWTLKKEDHIRDYLQKVKGKK